MRSPLRILILVVTSVAPGILAESPVRILLSPKTIVTDSHADSNLPSEEQISADIRSKLSGIYGPQMFDVDNQTEMISADEPLVVLLPSVTLARVSDEERAGVIHEFNAILVGDVSVLDPWTDASLYSATRMVSVSFEIGDSEMSHYPERASAAFTQAAQAWVDAVVAELKQNISPFHLAASTLAWPKGAKDAVGGIWPVGSAEGVRTGVALDGGSGHFVKVAMAFPQYSIVSDAANAARVIGQGEPYSLVVVQKPTERPEPTVQIRWLGRDPEERNVDRADLISVDAIKALFHNYLTKQGGIRVLPAEENNPAVKAQLDLLAQQISARTKQVAGNTTTFARENLIMRAAEHPDSRIGLGLLEMYHGTKTGPDGDVQNYYRATFLAASEERVGNEENPQYAVNGLVRQVEELASTEKAGIRTQDISAVYLTLFRNAMIHLAEKARTLPIGSDNSGGWKEGTFQGAGVNWEGTVPATLMPVSWLRPLGDLRSETGKDLGMLYRPLVPRKGFMNVGSVSHEKVEAGDILRYRDSQSAPRPMVGLRIVVTDAREAWIPDDPLMLMLDAVQLQEHSKLSVICFEQPEDEPAGIETNLLVKLSLLKAETMPNGAQFKGQWRLQVRRTEADAAAPALFQNGIEYDSPVAVQGHEGMLAPADLGGWGASYMESAMRSLLTSSFQNNLENSLKGKP